MRNTIFLDGAASMYTGESLLHSLQRKKADGDLTYQEVLESIQDYTESRADKTQEDVDAMTISEYKEYIAQKIAALPRHETKASDTIIVDITDAGFQNMHDDPDYEAWVIDTVAKDLSTKNSLSSMTGGRCAVHRFGANESQYSTESWGKARDVTDLMASITASEDAFWRGESSLTKRLSDEHMAYMRQQQLQTITQQITNLRQQQAMTAINNINTKKL